MIQELVADTTPYSIMNMDRNPRIIVGTGINGSTPASSFSGTSAVASYPRPTPPSVCRWYGIIANIRKTVTGTTPSFRNIIGLHTYIDSIFTNDSNVPSVGSQKVCDEFSIGSGINVNLRSRMDVAAKTVQPMQPQLISHGLPIIDKFDEN